MYSKRAMKEHGESGKASLLLKSKFSAKIEPDT